MLPQLSQWPLITERKIMPNTYTWAVTAMDCSPQEGDNTDVVFTVHWNCSGTNGTYGGSTYSTCSVPLTVGTFTPYAQLTKSQVLSWVWNNGVDKTATEEAVGQQIESQVNPQVVTPPLPWAESELLAQQAQGA
jgi:hypothetical protein